MTVSYVVDLIRNKHLTPAAADVVTEVTSASTGTPYVLAPGDIRGTHTVYHGPPPETGTLLLLDDYHYRVDDVRYAKDDLTRVLARPLQSGADEVSMLREAWYSEVLGVTDL